MHQKGRRNSGDSYLSWKGLWAARAIAIYLFQLNFIQIDISPNLCINNPRIPAHPQSPRPPQLALANQMLIILRGHAAIQRKTPRPTKPQGRMVVAPHLLAPVGVLDHASVHVVLPTEVAGGEEGVGGTGTGVGGLAIDVYRGSASGFGGGDGVPLAVVEVGRVGDVGFVHRGFGDFVNRDDGAIDIAGRVRCREGEEGAEEQEDGVEVFHRKELVIVWWS